MKSSIREYFIQLSFRLVFFTFLLPILQAYIVSDGLGHDIKNLKIAYTNDEISCQNYSSIGGCIYDENFNRTMSCDVMKNLESHDFALVSEDEIADLEPHVYGLIYRRIFFVVRSNFFFLNEPGVNLLLVALQHEIKQVEAEK